VSQIRAAIDLKDFRAILEECDKFRDDTLPESGIRVEDRKAG